MALEFREAINLPPSHRNSVHNSARIDKNPKPSIESPHVKAQKAKTKSTWFGQGLSMINKAGFAEFNEFGFNFGFEKTGAVNKPVNTAKPANVAGIFDGIVSIGLKTEDIQKTGAVTIPPVVDENATADEVPTENVFEEVPVITEPEAGSGAGDGSGQGQSDSNKEENPFE